MQDQIWALTDIYTCSLYCQVMFIAEYLSLFTGRHCIKGSGDKSGCCWIEYSFSSRGSLKEITYRRFNCRRMPHVKFVLVILWNVWEHCKNCAENWKTLGCSVVEQCWLWVFIIDKELLYFLLKEYTRQKQFFFFNQISVDFWFICKYVLKFLSWKAEHFPAIQYLLNWVCISFLNP